MRYELADRERTVPFAKISGIAATGHFLSHREAIEVHCF